MSGKKRLQFSLNNFNKFRRSFVIFDMNHPENYITKKIENLFQVLCSGDVIVTSLETTISRYHLRINDPTMFCPITLLRAVRSAKNCLSNQSVTKHSVRKTIIHSGLPLSDVVVSREASYFTDVVF